MVFDKGVFGTRKTGRHPRVAETREDKQMATAQEKRHSISLSIWQCSFLSPLVLTLIIFHLTLPYLKRKEARCISINPTLLAGQHKREAGWTTPTSASPQSSPSGLPLLSSLPAFEEKDLHHQSLFLKPLVLTLIRFHLTRKV